jgi:hypothetical protein
MYAVSVFAAVESDAEESIEAHPSIWLSPGRTNCRWPPFKLNGAIIKCSEPRESWSSYGVRKVLYMCGKYISDFSILYH